MKPKSTTNRMLCAMGLLGAVLVSSGSAVGQSVDDPFELASARLTKEAIGEIVPAAITLEGPAFEQPTVIGAQAIDPIQSDAQMAQPLKSVVETNSPQSASNPFTSQMAPSQERGNDPAAQVEIVKPSLESQWRATEPADAVPQLNAPQPLLNAPQLNSPANLNEPIIIAPAPLINPPTMTAPQSLNYNATPGLQSALPRFAPRVCEDEYDCPYNRVRRSEPEPRTGYLPYGGYSDEEYDEEYGYRSRYDQDRRYDSRRYDPRADRLLDEIYQTSRPVMMVPMVRVPVCPYDYRY